MTEGGPTRQTRPASTASDLQGALRDQLGPDEHLLWWGRPDPRAEAIGLYLGCFGAGLALVGLLIGGVMLTAMLVGGLPVETRAALGLMLVVPLGALVAAGLLLRQPRRLRDRARRSAHAITNQRLLTLVRGARDEITFVAARAIGPVHLSLMDGGKGTLTIETHSTRAPGSTTRLTQPLSWFGIEDAQTAYRLIAQLQREAASPP